MSQICIPIPESNKSLPEDVEILVKTKGEMLNYQLVSFPWDKDVPTDREEKVNLLKKHIDGFDKNWELIQILTPAEEMKHVQLLFRKNKYQNNPTVK